MHTCRSSPGQLVALSCVCKYVLPGNLFGVARRNPERPSFCLPSAAHAGLPLAVYLLSRGKHFHQLPHARTYMQSVAAPGLRRLKAPWANMQISQARTGGPVHKQDKEPCNCLLTWIMHVIQADRRNNYPLCQPLLSFPHSLEKSRKRVCVE